jgi:hypothetical protein
MEMARRGRKSGTVAHPLVRRMIEDPEFRSTVHEAIDSARSVFTQLNASKAPAKKLAEDSRLQGEVKSALETLQQTTSALLAEQQQEQPRRRKRRGRRLLVWISFGTVIAFVASPRLRNKALDKMFGAEEEFQYSPPPAPPPTPFADVAPAAAASQKSTAEKPKASKASQKSDGGQAADDGKEADGNKADGSSTAAESPTTKA